MSLWTENKIEAHVLVLKQPWVYFPSLAPRALSHCTVLVMYTPAGPQRCSPLSQGLPGDACMERLVSTLLQPAERLPPFDSYYHQHRGPGNHMGPHLQAPAHISCHAPPDTVVFVFRWLSYQHR